MCQLAQRLARGGGASDASTNYRQDLVPSGCALKPEPAPGILLRFPPPAEASHAEVTRGQ